MNLIEKLDRLENLSRESADDYESYIGNLDNAWPKLRAVVIAAKMLVPPEKDNYCTHVEDSGCPSCSVAEQKLMEALAELEEPTA
jgi:hypothetical protein